MKDERIHRLVSCAMLAALTCVATAFISFPIGIIPGAYVHAGDSIIYIAAYLFGPLCGALVGAVGSAAADVTLGAFVYAVPTFLIKGLLGCAAGFALRKSRKKQNGWIRGALLLACGAIVVAGYGIYETALYGAAAALASVPFNVIQITASALLGTLVIGIIGKIPTIGSNRENTK